MVYHVLSRADILAKPRTWVLRTFPGWLTYPLSCSLCFTFWTSVALGILGIVPLGVVTLLVAPVINLVLDLVVKALIRANEPPVIGEGKTVTQGDMSISNWRFGSMQYPRVDRVVGTAGQTIAPGEMVTVNFYPFRDETLNRPELIGRYVRRHSDGLVGPIREVFRCGDDCAGTFGQVCYHVAVDGGTTKIAESDCTILSVAESPFNPLDHEQTR